MASGRRGGRARSSPLVTLGGPGQLSGGYLYHCRLAELAGDHDAEVEFVPVRLWPDPFTLAHGDVVLVDSIAAWLVAPWAQRGVNRRRPLAAILHQPPGGIDNSAARRRIQAVLDRNLYRRCGLLIAASESLREDLVAPPHRLPADCIRVIAPGQRCARPCLPAAVPDLRHGRRAAAVSVGNWMARKGVLELLDALGRLPHDVTIDSQVHCYERDRPGRRWADVLHGPPEVTGDQMVAAMDAVGVDGAVLVSPFTMYRYDASYALDVRAAHPGRFALIKPVDPTDPKVGETIAAWAKQDGALSGPSIMMTRGVSPDPNDPGINRVLTEAAKHSLPVNLLCWGRLDQVDQMAANNPHTRLVIDHLGLQQPFEPPPLETPFADSAKGAEARPAQERRHQDFRRVHAVARAVPLQGHLGPAAAHLSVRIWFRSVDVPDGLELCNY